MEKQAKVVQLKTQLVKEGHTRHLLAETELMTLRIHCYAPGIGENALHSHTKEDHIFLVLHGTAEFNSGRDGSKVIHAARNHAVVLPAGSYYQFRNSGTEPLVMARIGAGSDKADQRLSPDGSAIPGRAHEQSAVKPVLIEGPERENAGAMQPFQIAHSGFDGRHHFEEPGRAVVVSEATVAVRAEVDLAPEREARCPLGGERCQMHLGEPDAARSHAHLDHGISPDRASQRITD